MPRVSLTPRKAYPFSCELTVRTTDMNYGGHLANDRVLALAHEARVAFLAHHGFTEADCGGESLIMADASLAFLGEAFGGDRLLAEVAAGEPGRSGFRLFHRFARVKDGREIALVETGLVCFDYATHRVRPLPPALGKMFSGVEQD